MPVSVDESARALAIDPNAAHQRSHRDKQGLRAQLEPGGLAAVAALATTPVLNRPDPALEERMQPDVLSELAIGKM